MIFKRALTIHSDRPNRYLKQIIRQSVVHSAFILLAACISPICYGQTLTEKLVLEDPAKLVQESSKKGDIVRGAILFHQGNINCANCHRPAVGKDRIGPDLSRLPNETTDASFVESILLPSKTIKKDYQTTMVLTAAGKVITGLVAVEDEQQIVLRTGRFSEELQTIAKVDIESRRLSTKSSMPDGLINELKSRQQFLDLLRYVIDLKRNGRKEDIAAKAQVQRELSDDLKGLVLIDQFNCVACHESSPLQDNFQDAHAPDLKWAARRLNPDYLTDFIADPQKMKPGTKMPHMLAGANEQTRKQSAEAIVQYLRSLDENQFQETAANQIDRDAVRRGNELFHSVGCVACHGPRNERGVEKQAAEEQIVEKRLEGSIPHGMLTRKYDHDALTDFLENPHVARPSGRMPNMVLSHREALDLASYLLQPSSDATIARGTSWEPDREIIQQGKGLFAALSCSQCHVGVIETAARPSGFTLHRPLYHLDADRGCLSDEDGDWPRFQLSESERKQIVAALGRSLEVGERLSPSQQIDFTLTSLNCTACHSRDNLGGVSQEHRQYFQTTNLNLGEQGRIPPKLTGVGAKLNPKWMRDVLVNHRSIRPYMKTRMPQFGENNVGRLVDLFASADHLADTEFATIDDPEKTRKLGHEIVGNTGLNCVACHTYQYKLSDTMPAVDLTEMAERLQKDWFYQYMLAPQKFSPGTVMPSYWPGGKAIRADIAGEPKDQIGAIWQYLLGGRQARAPRGVIREPLEIVVGDKARMLRRSYDGIGKRGIGVGYPGGVNVAFDAEQLRLAKIWRGKFVDPAGVWYGQGHGKVRTLGQTIDLPKGPELDDRSSPWTVDEGRPPNHHFGGYVLDDIRRPTFLYSLDSVSVEDHFAEMRGGDAEPVYLRRRTKMTATQPRDNLRFRVATDDKILATSSGSFRVGERLTVSIVSDHSSMIENSVEVKVEGEGKGNEQVEGVGKHLMVPLAFSAGQTHELVIEYRWE